MAYLKHNNDLSIIVSVNLKNEKVEVNFPIYKGF